MQWGYQNIHVPCFNAVFALLCWSGTEHVMSLKCACKKLKWLSRINILKIESISFVFIFLYSTIFITLSGSIILSHFPAELSVSPECSRIREYLLLSWRILEKQCSRVKNLCDIEQYLWKSTPLSVNGIYAIGLLW